MPSPTSNNTSPTRTPVDNEATRAFLERERASLEALNSAAMSHDQLTDGSQEAIAKDVAGLAISSQPVSPTAEQDPFVDDNGMDVDGEEQKKEDTPASTPATIHMDVDHNLQRESEKIAYYPSTAITCQLILAVGSGERRGLR